MRPEFKAGQLLYLLSFLAILVDRAGGALVIEELSKYAGNNLEILMDLDKENDKVTLRVKKEARHETK